MFKVVALCESNEVPSVPLLHTIGLQSRPMARNAGKLPQDSSRNAMLAEGSLLLQVCTLLRYFAISKAQFLAATADISMADAAFSQALFRYSPSASLNG